MSGNILTDDARQKIAQIADFVFHGEDSDFDPESTEPDKIESELDRMVREEGFVSVTPGDVRHGTARNPYIVPDSMLSTDGKYVVKFARYKRGGESGPEKGRIQNECEVRVWNQLNEEQRQFFVPIRASDPNYFWLVMDYAECFVREDGEVQYDEDGDVLYAYDVDDVSEVTDDMEESGVQVNDWAGSFGYHEGQLKCLDYGINCKWYRSFTDKEAIVEDYGDYEFNHPSHYKD